VNTLTCFGEILLRLSSPGADRLLDGRHLEWHVGGSELNAAAQATQLGVSSTIVSVLPANSLADAMLARVQSAGVTIHAVRRDGPRVGVYFHERGSEERPLHVIYDRAGSSFASSSWEPEQWPALLGESRWVHSTGITAALGDQAVHALRDARSAARASGVRVSIDLNYREALWAGRDPQRIMPAIVAGVDLLIGNRAACQAMLGLTTADDSFASLAELARRVRDHTGARRVAITRRVVESAVRHTFGAVYVDSATDAIVSAGPWAAHVVDRVGSGDAFAGALLASLIRDDAPADAIPLAVAAGIAKLAYDGDMTRAGRAELESIALAREGSA
jgi:2-dehydro-3-deoxygluconokinase